MSGKSTRELLARAAPSIFVLLWSTGFIGAKLGLPHAEPFTFLSLRMLVTLAILGTMAALLVRSWPLRQAFGHSMVTGIFVHAIYLGGVFFAISRGMPAGVAALVVALQPLATAFLARFMLGERLTPVQMGGLVAGLFGVLLVIWPKLSSVGSSTGINAVTLSAVFASVIGISLGSVYQKRYVAGIDIRVGTLAQYCGALIPLAILSLTTEDRVIDWSPEFIFALAWLVIVLSIGAIFLLMLLIRTNTASGTASLFYLVPGATSVMAYLLFGESLVPMQLAGMVIVMAAVAIATRIPARE